MKEAILKLKPQSLWEHFYEISQIPRCSKDETRVRQYVIDVAKRNRLNYRLDDAQNVVVKKPATPGREKAPVIVLQSHVDMVCEKNKDTRHDFSSDPIRLLKEGDWVRADGTTLGSDNGIGVAAALAVMESRDIEHGPLEFLFTMDEETGLTGATNLGNDVLEGRTLLNMDSEEDGAVYIGCAGGRDTELFYKLKTETVPAGHKVVRVRVSGLQGGHSGLQIGEGLGNAIKLVTRFLRATSPALGLRLTHIDGGSKHNAIPRECDAIVALPADKLAELKAQAQKFEAVYKNELHLVDPGVTVRVDDSGFDNPGKMFSTDLHERLLNVLHTIPHGVLGMSHAVEGLVETSTNLAVIKTGADAVSVLTSQRSSVNSALDNVVSMMAAAGELSGARIHHTNGYPAWQPNPDSPALKVAKKVHQQLFGTEPEVKAIHAGLECGIIGDKFPGMDMISFGPTILGAHSPDERVQVSTVEKFWDFLQAILKEAAKKMMHRLVKMARRAQHSRFHLWLLNRVLWRIIPFNRPHRLEIVKISDDALEIKIPYRRSNFNHIKGLHACCLATVAEYATGLLLVMQVDPTRFRLIMQSMHMEYHYQGKMDGFARFAIDKSRLEAEVFAPLAEQESVIFAPEVQIHDREGNHLVTGTIHWQIKRWDKVKTVVG